MDVLFQMLENTADGAFVINENQEIIFWNQAAQDMLGFGPDDVSKQYCYELLEGLDDSGQINCCSHCAVMQATLRGESITNFDTFIRTKWGQPRWVNVSIFTMSSTNHNEHSQLVVHLFRDATRKKQNEQFVQQVLNAAGQFQNKTTPVAEQAAPPEELVNSLTDREREVLTLLARVYNTDDIAQALSISQSTVRNHVQNILHKLRVHSRLEAVTYALKNGLVSEELPSKTKP